jgi:hypothetical protein
MCGNRNAEKSGDSKGADQIDFQGKTPGAQEARVSRLPLSMTHRYNFRVIITKYITLDR